MKNETLIHTLSAKLLSKNRRLTTVESCTGGMLAAQLTSVAGSSTWFEGGYVTYSNRAKIQMVDVSESSLQSEGAVSEQVALEMAIGGVNNSVAQCAISITGIAGPDGGSDEKPVGTVCFAWVGFGLKPITERCQFVGDRAQIRDQSAHHALNVANQLL